MSLPSIVTGVLAKHDGVATHAQLREVTTKRVIERATERGDLVRMHPRTYAGRDSASLPWTRIRAALAYAGPRSCLSHTTGLAVHAILPTESLLPVHVSVPVDTRRLDTSGVTFHRSRPLGDRQAAPVGLRRQVRGSVPVLALEGCLVTAWPLLPPGAARAAVLTAIGDRRTMPARVLGTLSAVPGASDRAAIRRLLELVSAGCQSPLEIFGLLHVFRHPDMPESRHQYLMRVGQRSIYLDVAYPEVMLNIELDGRDWHGGRNAEADRRRDSSLAALGWQTLRFSGARLFGDPEGVRREILAVYRARLQFMGPRGR